MSSSKEYNYNHVIKKLDFSYIQKEVILICLPFLTCPFAEKSKKVGKSVLGKMSCWCGLDCRLLSGILPRSVAPHSWTHSDTMLEDGMDHGYVEAADMRTQGFVTYSTYN